MITTSYNATIEIDLHDPGLDVLDHAVEQLADYHPAISISPRGYAEATITLPADSIRQATVTALAVVAGAFAEEPVACTVMTTDEFDARQAFVPMPDLVSVAEAAELLGISRQRVLQKIVAHQLPAIRVGRDYAIPRLAVTVIPADG